MVTLSLYNLPNNEKIKITKGASVSTIFDDEMGGVIDILVFNEAIVEHKNFIRPNGGFAMRMVFRRKKYADNADPCFAKMVSQRLPYRYLELGEILCDEGQLLYTKEPRNVFNTSLDENNCHRTSLIITNLDVEIFTALIKAFKCVGLIDVENVDNVLKVIKHKYEIFQKQIFIINNLKKEAI